MRRGKNRVADKTNHDSNNNDDVSTNTISHVTSKVHRNGKPKSIGALRRRLKGSHSSSSGSKSSSNYNFAWKCGTVLIAAFVALFSIVIVSGNLSFVVSILSGFYSFRDASSKVVLGPGGWRLATQRVLQKYDPGVCNIERISVLDLSVERFESEIRYKKPVLITFPGGASDWTDPVLWSRDSLVKEYSKWSISSGESTEIVRKGGNAQQTTSFQTFINQLLDNVYNGSVDSAFAEPMNYAFDRKFYWQTKLPKTLRLPPYFTVDRSKDDSIFFLGTSLTGVVFHKHSDTWNGVAYGRKRWFLYPSQQTPPGGVHHGYSAIEWVNSVYPNLTQAQMPMECVQEAGEILYLPEGTYHATLNLGDTIAVAIQKKDAHLKTEILSYEATDLINKLQDKPPKNPRKDRRSLRLLDVYLELLKLLPGSAEVMMKLGDQFFEMGEYEESVQWNLKAIEKEPYFILAYVHLGQTYAKLKRFEEAEQQFQKAIALSPKFWDIYKEYGEFLYSQRRVSDALLVYKKGTELKPDLMPFWYFYKVCQEETGDLEGAKETEKIMDELRSQQSDE